MKWPHLELNDLQRNVKDNMAGKDTARSEGGELLESQCSGITQVNWEDHAKWETSSAYEDPGALQQESSQTRWWRVGTKVQCNDQTQAWDKKMPCLCKE